MQLHFPETFQTTKGLRNNMCSCSIDLAQERLGWEESVIKKDGVVVHDDDAEGLQPLEMWEEVTDVSSLEDVGDAKVGKLCEALQHPHQL